MSSINVCDGIIRIRNAYLRFLPETLVKKSKFIENIMNVLQSEGYILDYTEENEYFRVKLKYVNSKPALRKVKLISKPSRRVYGTTPKPFHCFGITIISTSKGVMPGYKARKMGIGGEILMEIF